MYQLYYYNLKSIVNTQFIITHKNISSYYLKRKGIFISFLIRGSMYEQLKLIPKTEYNKTLPE